MPRAPERTAPHTAARLSDFFGRRRAAGDPLWTLISDINSHVGRAVIFGGMVRDFARGGAREFRSDVDIVVESDARSELRRVLSRWRLLGSNRFGGYSLSLGTFDVDLWLLQDTWAFRQGLVQPTGVASLLQTTFFDWDAIAYDTKARFLHALPDYFDRLNSSVLDINLDQNPNPRGAAMRALRWVSQGVRLSPTLAGYVGQALRHEDTVSLRREMLRWEKTAHIAPSLIANLVVLLLEHLASSRSSTFPVSAQQLSLPLASTELFATRETARTKVPCNRLPTPSTGHQWSNAREAATALDANIKTSTAARGRARATLALRSGAAMRHTYDCKQHGAVNLHASFKMPVTNNVTESDAVTERVSSQDGSGPPRKRCR